MTGQILEYAEMTYIKNEPYVPFLSNEAFEKEIKVLIDKATRIQQEMTDAKMHSNVMDPFGSVIEQAGFGIDFDNWLQNERTRQMQKSFANAIGEFHQNIIGHINGWENLGRGQIVDLKNKDRKIIAEVKNKHNTVTGAKLCDVYDVLYGQVMPKNSTHKDYMAYLVQIVPQSTTRYDEPFTPSESKTGHKKELNEKIRRIDGYSFYALASGHDDAYHMIFAALPDVIKHIKPSAQISVKDAKELFKRAYG